MVRIVADLAGDWRQLDERIEPVTDEIETLAAALPNKLARIAWTVLAQGRDYEERITKPAV
jgi:hypothetical protein